MTPGDFAAAVLDPRRDPPQGVRRPDGGAAGKRFDVYRNNVVHSLGEALAAAFPVVRKLIGASRFTALAGDFLRAHPPDSPLLMLWGAALPEFLEIYQPLAGIAYLPDTARLEQALRESYHAADAEPLPADELGALPADRLMAARLEFAPSVRLVRSRWPIHAIWRFNTEPGAPIPAGGGQNVLVTRPGFDPSPAPLAPGGGSFVAALLEGRSFGTAVAAAEAAVPDFDLAGALGALLAGQAIIGLEESP